MDRSTTNQMGKTIWIGQPPTRNVGTRWGIVWNSVSFNLALLPAMRPLLLLALFPCAMAAMAMEFLEPDESWPPPEAERAREIYDDLGNLTFPITKKSLAQQFPGHHEGKGLIPTKSLPSFFPRLT